MTNTRRTTTPETDHNIGTRETPANTQENAQTAHGTAREQTNSGQTTLNSMILRQVVAWVPPARLDSVAEAALE